MAAWFLGTWGRPGDISAGPNPGEALLEGEAPSVHPGGQVDGFEGT